MNISTTRIRQKRRSRAEAEAEAEGEAFGTWCPRLGKIKP
jgi:hypothetical protein